MDEEKTFDKKGTIKYLFWAFFIAWVMQGAVFVLIQRGQVSAGQLLMAGLMFAPLLAVVLSGNKLKGMGWIPRLSGNFKNLLAAWFLPGILTIAGAALYFLIFPGHFDMSGAALVAEGGTAVMDKLEEQGMTYSDYIVTALIGCFTYAPLINMLPAIGEEAGWRGYLYPQLKLQYGTVQGRIFGGIIWGIWHWPLIVLNGYEYGRDYFGFPVTGMIIFCVFTVLCGILCDWVYERSECIWFPAILHGSFNAIGTIPMAVCAVNTGSCVLLGPAPNGLIAEIPMIIFAALQFTWCTNTDGRYRW